MKLSLARQGSRHFFAADYASSNVASIVRVIRELFDATPLGIVIGVLRTRREKRLASRAATSANAARRRNHLRS